MRVFRQHAAGITRGGLFPGLAPRLQFFGGHFHGQFPLHGINDNRVAVLHQTDNSAEIRFRRHVAHDETMAAAAEPAVGDEGHVFAQTFAHDGRGG